MAIKIKETIHHGHHQNYRTFELSGWSYDEFMEKGLMTSLYKSYGRNPWTKKCYENLRDTGHGEFGWADYDVTTD